MRRVPWGDKRARPYDHCSECFDLVAQTDGGLSWRHVDRADRTQRTICAGSGRPPLAPYPGEYQTLYPEGGIE